MEIRDLALFFHILVLLGAIGLGTTLHTAEWRSRGTTTLRDLRLHAKVYEWGKLFSVLIFLLLATGYWLLHLDDKRHWDWETPWIWTAVVALIVLFISGGAVLGRHAAQYGKLLATQPEDGPVSPEVRAHAMATLPWAVSHMNTALAISVTFNMVNKPDENIEAIGTLVVGAVLGTMVGVLGARDKG